MREENNLGWYQRQKKEKKNTKTIFVRKFIHTQEGRKSKHKSQKKREELFKDICPTLKNTSVVGATPSSAAVGTDFAAQRSKMPTLPPNWLSRWVKMVPPEAMRR